jgi:hypothetical protein
MFSGGSRILAHISEVQWLDADMPAIYFDPTDKEGILTSGIAAGRGARFLGVRLVYEIDQVPTPRPREFLQI